MTVISKDQQIEDFIKEHGILGIPHLVNCPLEIFPQTYCFETKLHTAEGGEDKALWIYNYFNADYQRDLADILRDTVMYIEDYGGWPNFDTWNKQNDDCYYERQYGKGFAQLYYGYCYKMWATFTKVLGEDAVEKLCQIVRGE